MLAIIRTRWQTRPLSRRAKRRSSAAPGSLRKKNTDMVPPTRRCKLAASFYHILRLAEIRISALAPGGRPQRDQLGPAGPAIDLLLLLSIPVDDCRYERFDFLRRDVQAR